MAKTRLIVPLLWCVVACSGKVSVSKNELFSYLNDIDNGLIQYQDKGNVKCTLKYRPSHLMALNDLKSTPNGDSVINHYNQYIYLLVSYDVENYHKNIKSKQTLDQYLTKDIISDISLKAGNAQLELLDHMYVNMFGATSSPEVMLVFERKISDNEDLEFVIKQGPLGRGEWHFEIKDSDIKAVPRLKLTS